MLIPLVTFISSFAVVSLIALAARFSARRMTPGCTETALLGTTMKAAMAASIAAMYTAHWLIDDSGYKWGAVVAVSGGLFVVIAVWEKRRRLLSRH